MWLLPWDVAGVCEREVADPQMVHDAQGCHAAVDGVAALHADQAGRFVLFEGFHDACTGDKRMGERFSWGGRGRAVKAEPVFCLTFAASDTHEDLGVFLAHPVNHVDLLQCLSHRVFVLGVTGNVGRPKLEKKG